MSILNTVNWSNIVNQQPTANNTPNLVTGVKDGPTSDPNKLPFGATYFGGLLTGILGNLSLGFGQGAGQSLNPQQPQVIQQPPRDNTIVIVIIAVVVVGIVILMNRKK
jgi:hypothetical protein